MSTTTKPCDPPTGRRVGEHCDCWTYADPCCYCGNDDDDAEAYDEYIENGCPS